MSNLESKQDIEKKTTYALKTPHVVLLPVVFLSSFFGMLLEVNWMSPCTFFDLDLWPMTLTYELDLDTLLLDLHAKIQVSMSVRSAGIARRTDGQTDTHTHRHTHDVKTITPITSKRRGV